MSGAAWTEERDAALRALWLEGATTRDIARDLAERFADPAVTKNAVVGRAHRLNLPARPPPVSVEKIRTAAIARNRKRAADAAFIATRRPLLAQPANGCSFIEGDPVPQIRRGDDPHCNEPVVPGRPYCAAHMARAYVRVGPAHSHPEAA